MCQLLGNVQKDVDIKPVSAESIETQVTKQQKTIGFLDERCLDITSMIKHGKELLADTNEAPEFLSELVITLESQWKNVYRKANETLQTLQGILTE